MIVKPIKTQKVLPDSINIFDLLDTTLTKLDERVVVAITSKVVSLCENRVVPIGQIDKEKLIIQEAEWYCITPLTGDEYKNHTIVHGTFISSSGIDESNGNGQYILWPDNPQRTANQICHHLKKHFKLNEVGVIITDSSVHLSRWGAMGIAIGYSGFSAIKNYAGTPDLFGRAFEVSQANVAGGLAATAVLAMGEGAEQTPIVLIEDIPIIEFQQHDPSPEEVSTYFISPIIDRPFAPFFGNKKWLPGGRNIIKTNKE